MFEEVKVSRTHLVHRVLQRLLRVSAQLEVTLFARVEGRADLAHSVLNLDFVHLLPALKLARVMQRSEIQNPRLLSQSATNIRKRQRDNSYGILDGTTVR